MRRLTAVDHDAEADGARRDELRDLLGDLRIVDRLRAVRAEVPHGVSSLPEMALELFLQLCYLCLQRGGSFLMTLLHVPQSQSLLKFGV